MNSTRPNRSFLFSPLRLILSGKAAFSLKNGLIFLKQYSDAGINAGVFLANRRSSAAKRRSQSWLKCCMTEEMQQFSWCRIH
ncbi:MAG: hypothetical protein V4632_04575 [Pseudomonadota bacterium]